ncbi:MAG TPA: tetratricopeptide repeat protein [Candidatus Udaeobacter sp.]|jgi:TolB-like protein/Flp pilus assembly protein TadD
MAEDIVSVRPMPTEYRSEVQLKIGHVLFMDLVGYSTLLLDEQRQCQQQLTAIVRGTDQVRIAKEAGKLIRLPAGDGMALVFFDSPEAPVRCAIEISKKLKEYPQLKLRMGIHSGPIKEVHDVNDRTNVAGAGINVARRVMDCGDGGHILLSKRAAEDLSHSRRWSPCLHDLGECAVKHGVPIFLVNFYGEGFGNPELPKTIRQARLEEAAKATATGAPRTFRRIYLAMAATVVLIGVIGVSLWFYSRQNQVSTLAEEKSIAVLPFENFSPKKDNAFFTDGIQDDILTSLAKIKDLRVISRSSVMAFRDAAAQNVRHIGRKLGVANILEGSVRKEGERVVLNVQLIDARNNRQIWANRYDRTLADSLGLQGELAGEIAEALRATLSEEEKARVTTKPTQNADAYVLYLRANQISRNPDTLLEDYKTAEQLYAQAIELDPNFALAHAQLASVWAAIFHYYEPTDSWKTKALAEAETALRLQPNLAEAHFALGQYSYWVDQDYDGALEQLEIASRLSPSNGEIPRFIAAIRRRQGKWQEALEAYERVAKLDPQNPNTVRELLQTETAMRRWKDAERWAQRWRILAPDSLVAKIQTGYVDFWWKGDTQLLKSLVDQVPPDNDPDGVVTAARWDAAMLRRDYSAAKRVLQTSAANDVSYTTAGLTPKAFLEGCTYLTLDDHANAMITFESVRPVFEAALKEAPASAERHAVLGSLYAFMGRKDAAIREGRRAVELKPESKDAVDGPIMSAYLALIYARVGENDLAIPLIERLLKTPGAIDSADYSITVNDLKYRWEWDPLRNDPRFQKLIGGNTP